MSDMRELVEHDLAKVGVAGSSPVSRSGLNDTQKFFWVFFLQLQMISYSRYFTAVSLA